MTAEEIYRHLLDSGDEIGLATVYRVLTQFEAAGLVLKHNFEGGTAVYEIDRGGHHDHMVDVDTGRIIEFESAEIEKLQQEVAEKHGYQLEEHSLVLYVRKRSDEHTSELQSIMRISYAVFCLKKNNTKHKT